MKKAFGLLVAMMFAVPAFAGISKNSSWEEIMSAKTVVVKAPTVYMGRSVDYTFVCQDGNSLRTIKPVDTTVSKSYGDREEVVVVGSGYLSTPINYTHTVENCFWNNNQRLCKNQTVKGSYALTVSIPVYRLISTKNADHYTFLFNKSYTVPQCD
ncbi:hypothetical protein [Bdellovibrio sp. NC01]|uniref:hypothetical protein n=1 Tax=Bdellovibrio sp. NC01 TaxID=2220073 RepID=UPI00115706CA|nr:hypothetical protein [Bdellovibrio sp. NC01]QDK38054.1 hypothetical protein DOE51_10875 [Bdellovibrio sp. NC01]